MKISGDKPYVLRTYLKKPEEDNKVNPGKNSPKDSPGVDRVEISTKAREKEIKAIRELVETAPDVREEKVMALKNAVEEGTYRVKGEEVAKKMIEESIDEFA
jgi:negative regulator of flagellin synthesis FlgM